LSGKQVIDEKLKRTAPIVQEYCVLIEDHYMKYVCIKTVFNFSVIVIMKNQTFLI